MIRALIGRFVKHCIDVYKRRRFEGEWRKVDLKEMTDGEVSAFVHGRKVDWSAIDARRAAKVQAPGW